MQSDLLTSNLSTINLPRYIAVEGPIGVGKTSLCKKLAETFNYNILLEAAEDNPFLERFYQNPRKMALQTQLFFLMQRMQQLEDLRQDDLFEPIQVADFLIEKDRLFAQLTLEKDEFRLYDQIYQHLTISAPTPGLVIYLQAPANILLERIQKRGIGYEQQIKREYLENLNEAYARLFHFYETAPLLIINSANFDPINSDEDYQALVKLILEHPGGRTFFNPSTNYL